MMHGPANGSPPTAHETDHAALWEAVAAEVNAASPDVAGEVLARLEALDSTGDAADDQAREILKRLYAVRASGQRLAA